MASSYSISLVDSVVRDLDTTIVGWFLPLSAVAVYRMAKNFALMVWKAGDPVFFVVMPELARMAQANDMAVIRAFVVGLSKILLVGAALLLLIASVVVPIITTRFLGPEFGKSTYGISLCVRMDTGFVAAYLDTRVGICLWQTTASACGECGGQWGRGHTAIDPDPAVWC
ncbi:MAG: hypothetical protein R3F24_12005 [Gammaproteobacteria bacterium]